VEDGLKTVTSEIELPGQAVLQFVAPLSLDL